MRKSRLTEFALELVSRKRRRVLDYEPAVPRRTLRDRWAAFIDWWWGYPCLLVFLAGLMMAIASFSAENKRTRRFVGAVGAIVAAGALRWRYDQKPRW